MTRVACVVIGRNEEPRLQRCLESVRAECELVVYVDSASTDDSVGVARRSGVDVVELDGNTRMSAARGRNAGVSHLERVAPGTDYVQFIDGDSELSPGFIARGVEELEKRPKAAAVCGRLREKNRAGSIYNRVCDVEWTLPYGEIEWCGGIAMMRVSAFREVGGFDPTLIAGEEPDLCAKFRARGYQIWSISHDMALHDADMMQLSQWWQRNVRTGHAYAEAIARRPDDPAMHATGAVRSILFWGLAVPGASLLLAPPTGGLSLVGAAAAYPTLFYRIYQEKKALGFSESDARVYAAFCVLAKFPQAFGLVRYEVLRLLGERSGLIEHKRSA
jgi:GT2 family glycosyltransferase